MSEQKKFSPDDVDALVRDVLRGEATQVDVDRLRTEIVSQLRASTHAEKTVTSKHTLRRRILSGRGIGIAAALMICAGIATWLSFPKSINAHAILASAERVPESDRCYVVSITGPATARSRNFLLRSEWDAKVWAQGRRFRVSMHSADKHLIWGQDGRGNVWVVANPNLGLIFRGEDIPKSLRGPREILGLNAQRLTSKFNDQYILEPRDPEASDGSNVVVIQAKVRDDATKAMASVITSAQFVIDRDSYLIRRLTLVHEKGLLAHAQVTFRLLDDVPPPGNIYRLVDNLNQGAKILDSSRAEERDKTFQTLMRSLGATDFQPSS